MTSPTDTAFYVFVANDVHLGPDEKTSATEIADRLLKLKFWAFTKDAPVRSRLNAGDTILLYLAGNTRQHFYATCKLASGANPIKESQREVLSTLGLSFLRFGVELQDVKKLDPPIKIRPLLDQLNFIKSKQYYGLNLRLPIVPIDKGDFETIVTMASHNSIGLNNRGKD